MITLVTIPLAKRHPKIFFEQIISRSRALSPHLREDLIYLFYTGKTKKKTFSRPAKMIDYVESHVRRESGPTVACRHPVYEAAGQVLETVEEFKYHVKKDHSITLRDPWYVR